MGRTFPALLPLLLAFGAAQAQSSDAAKIVQPSAPPQAQAPRPLSNADVLSMVVVTKAERGGNRGRAGRIAWTMREVAAADGTRVPLQFSGRMVGDGKGAKVAAQMALTGAVFWFAPPVALLHGFKRGENAVAPEGKRFDAAVSGAATVGVTPRR